jgi:hypothetical protein
LRGLRLIVVLLAEDSEDVPRPRLDVSQRVNDLDDLLMGDWKLAGGLGSSSEHPEIVATAPSDRKMAERA